MVPPARLRLGSAPRRDVRHCTSLSGCRWLCQKSTCANIHITAVRRTLGEPRPRPARDVASTTWAPAEHLGNTQLRQGPRAPRPLPPLFGPLRRAAALRPPRVLALQLTPVRRRDRFTSAECVNKRCDVSFCEKLE